MLGDARIFPRDRVTLVGVLNLTPDSFSDGGRFLRVGGPLDLGAALAAGRTLLDQGAHVIDVGGESTRPGAPCVPEAEEIARTAPLIEALVESTGAPISIDTRKAPVAAAAIAAGARVVNDVSGGHFDPELLRVSAQAGVTLILGHLRGVPETMQADVHFDDVLREVAAELSESVRRAEEAGVSREQIVVDPGIGFGKKLEHNLALLANVGDLKEELGLPVLVGPSRKSFLGELAGDPVHRREAASLAACAVAVFAGADAVRVHEPGGMRSAMAVASALREARQKGRA